MMAQQYEMFVEKFKRKKTSDDCYTPELVYNAVKDWVAEEYGLNASKFVRPFWPDTDYQDFQYPNDCVVVDNPPFSILVQIIKFYLTNEIKFFLFCQGKTAMYYAYLDVCIILTGRNVVFKNGASIPIGFITNLESPGVRSSSELFERINTANDETRKQVKKQLPKYIYPPEVMTSSHFDFLSKNGVDFKVEADEMYWLHGLDSQKPFKKGIYGYGILLSEDVVAERLEAEKAAADRATAKKEAVTKWELSDREWEIVKSLRRKQRTEEVV